MNRSIHQIIDRFRSRPLYIYLAVAGVVIIAAIVFLVGGQNNRCKAAAGCGELQGTSQTSSPQPTWVTKVSKMGANEVKAVIESVGVTGDLVVVDVRSPSEYRSGHLANSVNINVEDSGFAEALRKLDKSKTYIVYCRSGNRSVQAVAEFEKQGFKDVIEMAGGIRAWERESFDVVE